MSDSENAEKSEQVHVAEEAFHYHEGEIDVKRLKKRDGKKGALSTNKWIFCPCAD